MVASSQPSYLSLLSYPLPFLSASFYLFLLGPPAAWIQCDPDPTWSYSVSSSLSSAGAMVDPKWSLRCHGWSKVTCSCRFWRVHGYLLRKTPLSLLRRAIGFFPCRSPFTLLAADLSPCAAHPPKAFLGGFCLHRSSSPRSSYWITPLAIPNAAWAKLLFALLGFLPMVTFKWRHRLCRCLYFSPYVFGYVVWLGFTTSCRRTNERNLRSLVSARPFRWCFTRFHQDLDWLSCLRSPTFRHEFDHYVIRVSPDNSAKFMIIVDISVIGASFFISDARSCHRYLEPNDCSAPILLLLLVHRRWLDSGMVFSSLTHSIAEASSFSNSFV